MDQHRALHIQPKYGLPYLVGALTVCGIFASSLYSYILFHSLVEIVNVLAAFLIFVLAWHTRHVQDNQYLMFVGVASLFTGSLDLLHTLAYKGMGVFIGYTADLPTQLWIAFRYVSSLSFVIAPFFINRKINIGIIFSAYLGITAILVFAIFSGRFPACFVEGAGLTPFKIASEYVISLLFLAALGLLLWKREAFDQRVLRLMYGSILASIAAELAFTQYVSVYGPANMIGHFFLLASVVFIYQAFVVTGIVEPASLLFRNLQRNQEALRQSEAKYRSLFENMSNGFAYHRLVLDEAGKPVDYVFLELNTAFESLTGLKRTDILGKRVTEALPGIEHDPADWIGTYGKVALTGEAIRFEQHAEALDEWYSVSTYCPMRGYFATIFEDITVRKRAENVVQARLRLAEASSTGAKSVDEVLRLTLDEIETLTGGKIGFYHFLEEDQETLSLQRWSTNTVSSMCTAEGAGSHYSISKAGVWVDCVREKKPVIHNDYASLSNKKGMPNGHAALIREMVVPLFRGGRIVAIIGVGNKETDFTGADVEIAKLLGDFSWEIVERKRSEEALLQSEATLRGILDAANESVWLFSSDGLAILANRTGVHRLRKKIEDVIGKHLGDIFPPGVALTRMERLRQVVASGQSVDFEDTRDGMMFDHSFYPVFGRNGRVVRVASFSRDITERKRIEQVLVKKTGELEDLNKNLEARVEEELRARRRNEQILTQQSKLAAMGEMISAIAHQWRQPLNVVGLIVQNLQETFEKGKLDPDHMDRSVRKTMAQIEHMSRTIDDFRSFIIPDKEKKVFDAMRAVGKVLSLLSTQLSGDRITCRLTCHTHGETIHGQKDISECAEKTIDGYQNEFEHVVFNLVNNARDAILEKRRSDNGNGSEQGLLSFDFYNRDGWVIIEISDNGSGIPAAVMDRIFEPYFSTKDTAKGTGIGLYMSKVIVEDHLNGTLTAKNHEGGAIFTISLPQTWTKGSS